MSMTMSGIISGKMSGKMSGEMSTIRSGLMFTQILSPTQNKYDTTKY
jgi:hypothetical protein